MEERDLRLYYHDVGVLKKMTGKEHKPWKSIADIKAFLKRRKENNVIREKNRKLRLHLPNEMVVIEYFGVFNAKIVEIINPYEEGSN